MPRRSRLAAAFALTAAVVATLMPARTAAQPKAGPPAVPATYPTVTGPGNLGVKPGAAAELKLTGTNLNDLTGAWSTVPGATLTADGKDTKATLKGTVPTTTPVGTYFFRVGTAAGPSNLKAVCVDDLPEVAETDKAHDRKTPQPVPASCVVTGLATAEMADYFKFPVKAGEPVTVEVLARRLGSPLDPVVILSDATGRELGGVYADDTPGLMSDARLVFTPKQSGELIAEVRDSTYRGGADYAYRLRIGAFPGATTAFPLFVQRGQSAEVTFTGPHAAGAKPVTVAAPKDPAVDVVYATPKRADGASGWPVAVRLSDAPQIVEAEPNNDPKAATKLAVPGGVSARFAEKGDVDHFRFAAKKGEKIAVTALTYEVGSPAEVYLRVLDAAGKEVGKSNPQTTPAKVEFTAAADGEFVAACEHLNYAAGPNEVYHLSVAAAEQDFAVAVGLDRLDVPAGGVGLLPITGLVKLNGFAGPVEVTVEAEGLSGALTLPATANPLPASPLFVPVAAKAGTKPGLLAVKVKAVGKVNGKDVVRFGTVTEAVKAALGNVPLPPPELTNTVAVAVTREPAFTLTVALEKPEVAKGATIKAKVTAKRTGKFADEIALTVASAPAGVTAKPKPVPKGKDEAEIELTAGTGTMVPAGAGSVVVRGTAKVDGKDVSVVALPVPLAVVEPKKK